jgi:hypothetical protein
MSEKLKKQLMVTDKWLRALFMVLFIIISWIAKIIVGIIALFQFIYTLFTGNPLQTLMPFSDSLAQYIFQIINFLTYVSEEKPFPFTHWPTSQITVERTKSKKK